MMQPRSTSEITEAPLSDKCELILEFVNQLKEQAYNQGRAEGRDVSEHLRSVELDNRVEDLVRESEKLRIELVEAKLGRKNALSVLAAREQKKNDEVRLVKESLPPTDDYVKLISEIVLEITEASSRYNLAHVINLVEDLFDCDAEKAAKIVHRIRHEVSSRTTEAIARAPTRPSPDRASTIVSTRPAPTQDTRLPAVRPQ